MDTLMKRSIFRLVTYSIVALGCLAYFLLGHAPRSLTVFLIPLLALPALMSQFAIKGDLELDEREQAIASRANVAGLLLSWFFLFIWSAALARHFQVIPPYQDLVIPFSVSLLFVGRETVYCYLSKRGLSA